MELRRYSEQQFQRLRRSLEEALSTGGVEAVHQARVASRRLEEPLELCRCWVNDKQLNRAIKRLKHSRKTFRVVRELDVLRASIPQEPETGLCSADIEEVNEELTAQRDRHWHRAQEKVDASDTQMIERLIGRVFDEVESATDNGLEPLMARLTDLAAERAEDALKYGPANGDRLDLHCTRVRLKRLRYALELRQALTGEPNEGPIRLLKAAQDRLGDWNDQLQAVALLSKIARNRRTMVEQPGFAAHLLAYAVSRLQRTRELADLFVTEWPALLAPLSELAAAKPSETKGR